MNWSLIIYVFVCSLGNPLINGHGFGGTTYVKTSSRYNECIEQIVEHSSTQSVVSYHCNKKQHHSNKILARARSTTNCYFIINLDYGPSPDIICSALQQFYLPEKNCWAPAHMLQVGDVLLTEHEGNLPITRITFVEKPLELYALKIECPHTFFVGRHSVLTHNMDLPITSFCWQLPATITAVGASGGILTGFMTAASGIAVGAIAASLIYSAIMDHKAKKYHKVEIGKDEMLSFAQKQNNSPNPSQCKNNNNSNQPQRPDNNKPRFTDKVANIYQLFALNEFGQKLKECSEPLNRLYEYHARIFRMTRDMIEYGLREGYVFYLDTLHYDHIEVFSEKGQRCVTVLNIDGGYNAGKFMEAISDGRNIKEWLR